jgi:small subunit ribosomal protein S17
MTKKIKSDAKKSAKIISGVVISSKMKDTIIVKVESYKKHPKYEKFVKKTKKISVHDSGNTSKEGEKVNITEVKPISKTKKFAVIK